MLFDQQLEMFDGRPIYFQLKSGRYWLNSLSNDRDFHWPDHPNLAGYLYLSDQCQLTSDIISQADSTKVILIVVPDWKHFQLSYQIYTQSVDSFSYLQPLISGQLEPFPVDSNLSPVDSSYHPLKQIVSLNIREFISEEAILEKTSKTNLELMKIRLAPSLDLEAHYQLKILIIGAGTIGCNLARGLLSWGITNLIFIDYSTVSASNLLRQSLFEQSDLGKPKAEAAATRISQIYPFSTTRGVSLEIPMPGHPATIKQLESKVTLLEELISQVNLVFLSTDNRESRWLPSLIAQVDQKPLINVAIGFDSWVVMRHPLKPELPQARLLKFEPRSTNSSVLSQPPLSALKVPLVETGLKPFPPAPISGQSKMMSSWSDQFDGGYSLTSLGQIAVGSLEIGSSCEPIDLEPNDDLVLDSDQFSCYFCPDVEGVQNTVKDRALDERCTVTRGGLSLIATGVAVELAVGLLNHPKRFTARGARSYRYQCSSGLTRDVPPQQIRGSLVDFSMTQYLSRRNTNCVCCSDEIVKYYQDTNLKMKFLEKVIVDANLLKSLSGDQTYIMPDSADISIQ